MSGSNKLRALKTCVQSRNATMSFSILLTLMTACMDCMPTTSPGYAVVVDAGSSGTRCWVYKLTPVAGNKLPKIEALGSEKSPGGLAKLYVKDLNVEGIKNKINDLLNFAKGKVPADQHSKSPIYFMATAGMRSLKELEAIPVFESINQLLNDKTKCPFKVEVPARILAGQEEGLFSWITVNYRQGNLDGSSSTGKTTRGVLECGGASLQIAFVPQAQILDSAYYFKFYTNTFLIYAHSFMNYGQDAVVDNLEKGALNASGTADPVTDPCKMKNFNEKKKDTDTKNWKGTGDINGCEVAVKKLFRANDFCSPEPCTVNNVYQPSIPKDMNFVSIGAFYNTFKDIGVVLDKPFKVPVVKEKAREYCSQDYTVFKTTHELDKPENKGKKVFMMDACTMAVYFSVLLSDAFKFPDGTEQITPVKQIQGVDIDWTVGALIYETEHGSGQRQSGGGSGDGGGGGGGGGGGDGGGSGGGKRPDKPCPGGASPIILKNFELFVPVVMSSLLSSLLSYL
ncbi:hypothetical protein HELRODRAFT_170977 [Helobdella robusta]|uniref:Ectonucleoside triphosphate diphosphohydrolase 1 n=1 Tax=Helobdella robusta TaxID=6412 RepID=T1F3N5_HELRO|nr:hypothetical protein HELRODRAFT_170977 [Helobdella robusta]ESO06941.1 hypothetical protein HELRODRAFT_170977 [Helobdella robusta]